MVSNKLCEEQVRFRRFFKREIIFTKEEAKGASVFETTLKFEQNCTAVLRY